MALNYLFENELPEKLDAAVKKVAQLKNPDLYATLVECLDKETRPAEIISEEILESCEDITYVSPVNAVTEGNLFRVKVNFRNKEVNVDTFFTGEVDDTVKNFGRKKVDWLLNSPEFEKTESCQSIPLAVTVVENGVGSKLKSFSRLYFTGKAMTGVYQIFYKIHNFISLKMPKFR